MKILFIKLDKQYISQFSKILIPLGVEFGHSDSYRYAYKILQKNKYNLIIGDIDVNNFNNYSTDLNPGFFAKLIGNSHNSESNLIVLTENQDSNSLFNYISNGIFGILYKNNEIKYTLKQFCFILKSFADIKKKYVSVQPKSAEVAAISLSIPTRKINIFSNITGISMKGVSFKTKGKVLPIFSFEKDLIKNAKLFLGKSIIDVQGKLILRPDRGVIIFHGLSRHSEKAICRYIADKIVHL